MASDGAYRGMSSSRLPHSHSTPAGVDGAGTGPSGMSRTPPSTPKKGVHGKMLTIRVQMLDDSVAFYHVQSKALGRILFEQVCNTLNLLEADYFGLEYDDMNGAKYWLDLEKPLSRQVGLSLIGTFFRFCVKFYTPDPSQLEEEYTRYLFCLQVKRDLALGAIQCNDNTAALMASYIVQAECGDFVQDDYPDHTYLSSYKFVPHQDRELERRIMENHKKHAGQSPAEADLNLLETARRCELYGMKMHPAKDPEGVPLNLAVAHMGIVVFQNFTKINTFSWAKIRKISFKRKRFLIKLHPEGYGLYKDTVEFFFEGRNECKNFWKKCVENHGFFRCSMVKRLPRQKTRVLSRGSSFRYSGKTQKQIVDFVRENYVKRQTFQRSQSFRHSSSVHSSVANVGASVSAHPLLPLGDNEVAGTQASLSCGSMTLNSMTETVDQSTSLPRKPYPNYPNQHRYRTTSLTQCTNTPTHTADIHEVGDMDTSPECGASLTASPQHMYPRPGTATGTEEEDSPYHHPHRPGQPRQSHVPLRLASVTTPSATPPPLSSRSSTASSAFTQQRIYPHRPHLHQQQQQRRTERSRSNSMNIEATIIASVYSTDISNRGLSTSSTRLNSKSTTSVNSPSPSKLATHHKSAHELRSRVRPLPGIALQGASKDSADVTGYEGELSDTDHVTEACRARCRNCGRDADEARDGDRPVKRYNWQRSASCKELHHDASTSMIPPRNTSIETSEPKPIPKLGSTGVFFESSIGSNTEAPVTRYDDSRRMCYSAAGSKTPSIDRGAGDVAPDTKVYSSSYPGTTSSLSTESEDANMLESGHGGSIIILSSDPCGSNDEMVLSHDDLSHDSYELLAREQDADNSDFSRRHGSRTCSLDSSGEPYPMEDSFSPDRGVCREEPDIFQMDDDFEEGYESGKAGGGSSEGGTDWTEGSRKMPAMLDLSPSEVITTGYEQPITRADSGKRLARSLRQEMKKADSAPSPSAPIDVPKPLDTSVRVVDVIRKVVHGSPKSGDAEVPTGLEVVDSKKVRANLDSFELGGGDMGYIRYDGDRKVPERSSFDMGDTQAGVSTDSTDKEILEMATQIRSQIGRTRSDPHPGKGQCLGRLRRQMLIHQKSFDLPAETEGKAEGPSKPVVVIDAGRSALKGKSDIPYVLHKRHVMNGTAAEGKPKSTAAKKPTILPKMRPPAKQDAKSPTRAAKNKTATDAAGKAGVAKKPSKSTAAKTVKSGTAVPKSSTKTEERVSPRIKETSEVKSPSPKIPSPPKVASPPKAPSPPKTTSKPPTPPKTSPPPPKTPSPPKTSPSPPKATASPPKTSPSPPKATASPPKTSPSPPKTSASPKTSPPLKASSPLQSPSTKSPPKPSPPKVQSPTDIKSPPKIQSPPEVRTSKLASKLDSPSSVASPKPRSPPKTAAKPSEKLTRGATFSSDSTSTKHPPLRSRQRSVDTPMKSPLDGRSAPKPAQPADKSDAVIKSPTSEHAELKLVSDAGSSSEERSRSEKPHVSPEIVASVSESLRKSPVKAHLSREGVTSALPSVRKRDRSPVLFGRLGLSEGSAFTPVGGYSSPTSTRRTKSLDAPVVSLHCLPPADSFSSNDDTLDNNGETTTSAKAAIKSALLKKLRPLPGLNTTGTDDTERLRQSNVIPEVPDEDKSSSPGYNQTEASKPAALSEEKPSDTKDYSGEGVEEEALEFLTPPDVQPLNVEMDNPVNKTEEPDNESMLSRETELPDIIKETEEVEPRRYIDSPVPSEIPSMSEDVAGPMERQYDPLNDVSWAMARKQSIDAKARTPEFAWFVARKQSIESKPIPPDVDFDSPPVQSPSATQARSRFLSARGQSMDIPFPELPSPDFPSPDVIPPGFPVPEDPSGTAGSEDEPASEGPPPPVLPQSSTESEPPEPPEPDYAILPVQQQQDDYESPDYASPYVHSPDYASPYVQSPEHSSKKDDRHVQQSVDQSPSIEEEEKSQTEEEKSQKLGEKSQGEEEKSQGEEEANDSARTTGDDVTSDDSISKRCSTAKELISQDSLDKDDDDILGGSAASDPTYVEPVDCQEGDLSLSITDKTLTPDKETPGGGFQSENSEPPALPPKPLVPAKPPVPPKPEKLSEPPQIPAKDYPEARRIKPAITKPARLDIARKKDPQSTADTPPTPQDDKAADKPVERVKILVEGASEERKSPNEDLNQPDSKKREGGTDEKADDSSASLRVPVKTGKRTNFDEEASTSTNRRGGDMSSTWRPFLLESSGSSSLEDGFFPPEDSAHLADEDEPSSTSNKFEEDSAEFPSGFGYPTVGSSLTMAGADMMGYGGVYSLSRTLSRISERSTTSEQERSDLEDIEDSTKPSSCSPSIDDESIMSSDRQPSLSSDPPSGLCDIMPEDGPFAIAKSVETPEGADVSCTLVPKLVLPSGFSASEGHSDFEFGDLPEIPCDSGKDDVTPTADSCYLDPPGISRYASMESGLDKIPGIPPISEDVIPENDSDGELEFHELPALPGEDGEEEQREALPREVLDFVIPPPLLSKDNSQSDLPSPEESMKTLANIPDELKGHIPPPLLPTLSEENWPSPPTDPYIFETPLVSRVETYDIQRQEARKVVVTSSLESTDPPDSPPGNNDASASDETDNHDDVFTGVDDHSSISYDALVTVRSKEPTFTGTGPRGSASEDTSMAVSASEWTSSSSRERQNRTSPPQSNLQNTLSQASSLSQLQSLSQSQTLSHLPSVSQLQAQTQELADAGAAKSDDMSLAATSLSELASARASSDDVFLTDYGSASSSEQPDQSARKPSPPAAYVKGRSHSERSHRTLEYDAFHENLYDDDPFIAQTILSPTERSKKPLMFYSTISPTEEQDRGTLNRKRRSKKSSSYDTSPKSPSAVHGGEPAFEMDPFSAARSRSIPIKPKPSSYYGSVASPMSSEEDDSLSARRQAFRKSLEPPSKNSARSKSYKSKGSLERPLTSSVKPSGRSKTRSPPSDCSTSSLDTAAVHRASNTIPRVSRKRKQLPSRRRSRAAAEEARDGRIHGISAAVSTPSVLAYGDASTLRRRRELHGEAQRQHHGGNEQKQGGLSKQSSV